MQGMLKEPSFENFRYNFYPIEKFQNTKNNQIKYLNFEYLHCKMNEIFVVTEFTHLTSHVVFCCLKQI